MAAPYPIRIKKTKTNGTETAVINSETSYGMVVSEIPFHFAGGVKAPYSNDWKDEHGTEVYLPDAGLKFEAYDMEVTFLYRGPRVTGNTVTTFSQDLRSFLSYLTGQDGNGSRLTIYDTYNNVGRQDVYVKSVSPDVFVRQPLNTGSDEEVAKFSITFTVCDPVNDITLTE